MTQKNLPYVSIDEFKNAFRRGGLERKWPCIVPYIKPELRIQCVKTEEHDIPIGKSKFGGLPDLPPQMNWPKFPNGVHVPFICQINVEELIHFDLEYLLPKTGILYFFYDRKEKYHIVRFQNDVSALARNSSNSVTEVYNACTLQYKYAVSIPNIEYDNIISNFTVDEYDIYDNICNSLFRSNVLSKLFGHSTNKHGPLEYTCELNSRLNKLDIKTRLLKSADFIRQNSLEIEASQYQWILLLQIDSVQESNMHWDGDGILYFWIKKKNLENMIVDDIQVIN